MTPRPGPAADLDRVRAAVRAVDAPDVVIGFSRDGERAVCAGGTGPPPPVPREHRRYEIGSASKTYTGLLLATLVRAGQVSWNDPAHPGRPEVTLLHLATHTGGLPRLPPDFYPQAVPRWFANPYARYPAARVLNSFVRNRPRHRPGSRWRYSNFGAAVLGHALAAATGTGWDALLERRVLSPLGLTATGTAPGAGDATGHRRDGRTPVPPLRMGGFQPAGAVRATPHDLLSYLEAHLRPHHGPSGAALDAELDAALDAVRRPVLRRGLRHRHTHTVTWFQHTTDRGPLLFHSGATCGQQAFLGFRPATRTAVVALCTRRFRAGDALLPTAYTLLADTP